MVNGNLAYALQHEINREIEIADLPVKYCTVTLSDVVSRGKRLEASIFDVEAKHAREIIEHGKYPVVLIGGQNGFIKDAYYPGRFKRIYCDDGFGEKFYLPSQMTDIYPKANKSISTLSDCNISELKLKPKTLLLTRSGTIGNVSYVSKTIENTVFSDDVIRVTFKEDVNLGYVYAYLQSKIGKMMLTTNGYGSVITHIEPEHLDTIPIPDAPVSIKKRINDLIVDSYELRDESNALIDEATALMVKELHFPDIHDFDVALYKKDANVDTFTVKLSDMAGRADASYHVPIVDAIIEHMERYAAEVTTVGDARISKNIILAGIFKRMYVEEEYGYPFLGGKEILQLAPKTEKYLSRAVHKARYEKELRVETNMVLVTDRGTIGTIAFVPEHWNGWAVSQNVLKVIPSNNDIAGYLYIYLNSDWGQLLVRRQTYGSVVDMIDNHSLESVEIPLLKNIEVQKHINDLALEANKKRFGAYKLEQQALQIINEEVIFAK